MSVAPTDLPSYGRFDQTIPVPLPPSDSLFVDRNGEEWRPVGHTVDGDVLLACDEPLNPEDRGEGESFPWTDRLVEAWFGPLVRKPLGGAV
jgi:hypothetical protein